MTKTIPNYLRIHSAGDANHDREMVSTRDCVVQFWDAYSEATGWRIDTRTAPGENLELLPAVTSETLESTDTDGFAAVGKSAAIRLAQSASQLADELDQNREAMRRQEAELASRAAILSTDSDRARLADRIEQTLADAAAACGCDAAALYMLDDETQYLKARAVFGLPPAKLEQPPRALRGSRGDLEAMVQGVVTVNDATSDRIDLWDLPEAFAAGICAAVQCDGIPIGTLWLFRNERAEFGIAESAAARLAASHLSLDLSQASRESAPATSRSDVPIQDISQWQCETLPIGAALAQQWRVDGMIESPRSWATGWHSWDVLPDGTLMLAIAEAVDRSARGAMNAATARAALAAHTGYRHTPGQLMQRISDTLWQTSTGEQLVSMLYARIDPETGEGEVASAGSITALIGSSRGYRPLVDGLSDPLNTHIDARCTTETFRMNCGETLLAYTRGLAQDGASQRLLGERLRTALQSDDTNPLAMIRRSLADIPLEHERGAVTLLRQPSS